MRLVALVVALVFLGPGILGSLPPMHSEWTTAPDPLIVRNGIGLLLGFLPNNIVLTVTRLSVGLAGLALLPSVETAFGVAPIAEANL